MSDKTCNNKNIERIRNKLKIQSFLVDIKNPPKGLIKLNEKLKKSHYENEFNLNDYLMVRYGIMFIGLLILMITVVINMFITISSKIILFECILMFISSYIFEFYLNLKIKAYMRKVINSIPLINQQIFNKIEQDKNFIEVVYELSKINSPYKHNFILAYELMNRNSSEGYTYLIDVFKDNYIRETIKVLKNGQDYDKETLVDHLKRIHILLVREYKMLTKKRADKDIIQGEISTLVPFAVVAISIAIPVTEAIFNHIINMNVML